MDAEFASGGESDAEGRHPAAGFLIRVVKHLHTSGFLAMVGRSSGGGGGTGRGGSAAVAARGRRGQRRCAGCGRWGQ
uniref:Uncharacterized protein n=1 Tax=Arundo donax TaxID=35708 RepID=A0A0A9ANZ8_ARUDO